MHETMNIKLCERAWQADNKNYTAMKYWKQAHEVSARHIQYQKARYILSCSSQVLYSICTKTTAINL